MSDFISVLLPMDLPEDWTEDQYVSPWGQEVGLTEKHGYNYLMKQVNNVQTAAVELAETLSSGLSDNLLDNGYLVDPVNRLKGYFVSEGTEYYSDVGLLTAVGTLESMTPVRFINFARGAVTVNNTEYYVSYSDMTEGYIHTAAGSFGFDRWWAKDCTVGLARDTDAGVVIQATNPYGNARFRQAVSLPKRLVNRRVVLSVLVKSISGSATLRLIKASGVDGDAKVQMVSTDLRAGMNYVVVDITTDVGSATYPYLLFDIELTIDSYIRLTGAKLQPGIRQTLAYQDANDNWLLTTLPNKVVETVRCNGASTDIGGQGMIVLPQDIGLSTANVMAQAEVIS